MSLEHSPARQRHAVGGLRFGRIPTAVETRGLSRGTLYKLAAQHRGLFRKHGAITIVDLFMLDDIIESFPEAEINVAS
jgi:hypothetical protein